MPIDEDEFQRFYEGNVRSLLGYALRRVSNPADAADVVAESMLVAWHRRRDMPAEPDDRPWLFGVARRVLANRRRGDQRRARLGERLTAQLSSLLTDDHAQPVSDSVVVNAALHRLGDDDRELLTLAVWEGLTAHEIANAMAIPSSTVRTRLQRARERLRAELTDWDTSTRAGHERDDERMLVRDSEGSL